MTERDIELHRQAGWSDSKLIELVRADEREKVAAWVMQRGYATGHGDTIEDLLQELDWQVTEREREACAKVCEQQEEYGPLCETPEQCAAGIRARGNI